MFLIFIQMDIKDGNLKLANKVKIKMVIYDKKIMPFRQLKAPTKANITYWNICTKKIYKEKG